MHWYLRGKCAVSLQNYPQSVRLGIFRVDLQFVKYACSCSLRNAEGYRVSPDISPIIYIAAVNVTGKYCTTEKCNFTCKHTFVHDSLTYLCGIIVEGATMRGKFSSSAKYTHTSVLQYLPTFLICFPSFLMASNVFFISFQM